VAEFVLGKYYPELGGSVFICGQHPRLVTFHPEVQYATRFESVEDALVFRFCMDHQLGGKAKYRVHEVLPGGVVQDVEP
jgi:hypothetical protein